MSDADKTLWGIRAGRLGVADSLFLKKNVIAIGWHEMGDITVLGGDREALKVKLAETHPKAKPGAIPVHAGQLFRFINEMQPISGVRSQIAMFPNIRGQILILRLSLSSARFAICVLFTYAIVV